MALKRQSYTQASIFASPNTSQLADTNVTASDRIWFWDVSANKWQLLSIGSGLSISGTTLTGTGAPATAEYIVAALDGGLSAERLATNTNSIIWDFATASAAKASVRTVVTTKTADYTILVTDKNTTFINYGAVAGITFDLPDSASCVVGETSFSFFTLANQVVNIDLTNASDTLYGYDPVNGRFAATLGVPVYSSGFRGDWMSVTYMGNNDWMAVCSGSWTV